MSTMLAASMRKSSSSTIVSANSSTSAGGLASEAIGIRPTRNGAIQLITRRSLCTRRATAARCTLTTTSSPVSSVAACTWAIEAAASGVVSNVANTSSRRRAEVGLDHQAHRVERLGGHLVAAQLELGDQLLGEQALAAGDDLPELDVRRPEALGGGAQAAGHVGTAGLRRGEATAPAAHVPRTERAAERADHGGDPGARWHVGDLGEVGHLGARRGAQLGGQRHPADLATLQVPRSMVAERGPVGVGLSRHKGMIAGAGRDRNAPGRSTLRPVPVRCGGALTHSWRALQARRRGGHRRTLARRLLQLLRVGPDGRAARFGGADGGGDPDHGVDHRGRLGAGEHGGGLDVQLLHVDHVRIHSTVARRSTSTSTSTSVAETSTTTVAAPPRGVGGVHRGRRTGRPRRDRSDRSGVGRSGERDAAGHRRGHVLGDGGGTGHRRQRGASYVTFRLVQAFFGAGVHRAVRRGQLRQRPRHAGVAGGHDADVPRRRAGSPWPTRARSRATRSAATRCSSCSPIRPVAGAPADYIYLPFAYLLHVQGGQIVSAEQVWTP